MVLLQKFGATLREDRLRHVSAKALSVSGIAIVFDTNGVSIRDTGEQAR